MAQYVRDILDLHVVLDFVDVDSAKWTQYAERHGWPSSLVYRREGRTLLSFERAAAASSAACVFVTRAEAELFDRQAPECKGQRTRDPEWGAHRLLFISDTSAPRRLRPMKSRWCSPGRWTTGPTSTPSYGLRARCCRRCSAHCPEARFHAVGMQPAPTVSQLAVEASVGVTGRVDDVRPYLQHAAVVVAPLRVARGIQNKILEAMSMANPVVTTTAAARSMSRNVGVDLEAAMEPVGVRAKGTGASSRHLRRTALGRAARHVWSLSTTGIAIWRPSIALLDDATGATERASG